MNYIDKLEYRNKLMNNLCMNPYNPKLHLDKQGKILLIEEWFRKYMPFLPNQVLDNINAIYKDVEEMKKQEETIKDLRYMFTSEK